MEASPLRLHRFDRENEQSHLEFGLLCASLCAMQATTATARASTLADPRALRRDLLADMLVHIAGESGRAWRPGSFHALDHTDRKPL